MNAVAPVEAKPVEPSPAFRHWQENEHRKLIAETLWSIGIVADTGQNFIALGDDIGLEYAVRQLIAGTKAARDVFASLKAMKGSSDAGR